MFALLDLQFGATQKTESLYVSAPPPLMPPPLHALCFAWGRNAGSAPRLACISHEQKHRWMGASSRVEGGTGWANTWEGMNRGGWRSSRSRTMKSVALGTLWKQAMPSPPAHHHTVHMCAVALPLGQRLRLLPPRGQGQRWRREPHPHHRLRPRCSLLVQVSSPRCTCRGIGGGVKGTGHVAVVRIFAEQHDSEG